MKPSKPVLSFLDYQRLYRVIATVLNSVDAHTAHACLFFSIAGAFILDKTYGLDARPLCGSAFYRVNDADGYTLAFTKMEGFAEGFVDSDDEAFHAWIECNGTVIDLMAPIFRENLISRQPQTNLQLARKMFQKPASTMAASPFELKREGDFFLQVNRSLTNELIQYFMSKPFNGDLVGICHHWYRPTPKPIPAKLGMGSNDGTQQLMVLDRTELVGIW